MTRNSLAALMLVSACIVLVVAMLHGQRDQDTACHPMLMPAECRLLHSSLDEAHTAQERLAIEAGYKRLLAEREQACRYAPDQAEVLVRPHAISSPRLSGATLSF